MAIEREIEFIETVAALKEALAEFPDDMRVGDAFYDGLCLRVYKDDGTGERYIEIL